MNDDLCVTTEKVVRCRHGVDCTMRFVTTRTDAAYKTEVTQNVCKICVQESVESQLRGPG